MLYALSIQSFVLIDHLDLEAPRGFTALTGETGAGKSIILDALALILGGPADRKLIRTGAEQASLTAEFSIAENHPAWAHLTEQGISFSTGDTLVLRRTLSRSGPSRAFVNGQAVAASVLSSLGESLVEIHGQHAASRLMQPACHMAFLDSFAGLEQDVEACERFWRVLEEKRADRSALEAEVTAVKEKQDWLTFAVEDLSRLAPMPEEVETLSAQRAALLQSERMSDAMDEAVKALSQPSLEDHLASASRATERVAGITGLEVLDESLPRLATDAVDAIERTLIELSEARQATYDLARFTAHDSGRLESVESRLFALRAAARKYDCLPERLPDELAKYEQQYALCEANTAALDAAREEEALALQNWENQAQTLSRARRGSAGDLEAAVERELEPLHMGRVKLRVRFDDLEDGESGHKGLERVEFEVETNAGTGFGPLKAIASGGELARFSLALKCALSQTGDVETLIFDEADQGVGGAVAAAIGERLAQLGTDKQVYAITHSPQVASAATRQWRVLKEDDANGHTISRVAQLDEGQRLEEIARMLSGSSITNEARAAALKLLEAA